MGKEGNVELLLDVVGFSGGSRGGGAGGGNWPKSVPDPTSFADPPFRCSSGREELCVGVDNKIESGGEDVNRGV